MTPDPVLVLAWLTLAHLAADFVLQTDRIAADKFASGRPAARALGLHWAEVALCLVPVVLAFGLPGVAFLVLVSGLHAAIDRTKVVLTRRAEARAIAEATAAHESLATAGSLGTAWTPVPAALFALDQLAHGVVIVGVWALLLSQATLAGPFVSGVDAVLGGWDRTLVHRVVLGAVVLIDLGIVNVRAGSLFVATLVSPRAAVVGEEDPVPASPARIGATIGVLERLLVVTLVLTGAETAIGLVIAAKTLARFRQLDDRHFAEYYLLGTMASVSVALASGLIGLAALAPLAHP
ncbi:MAG TPA: DUF3307 domain-containing protein [Candidatus Saccharimonadales bacterium]|nr:DUF3307 domain-containing protein [Candidatus Saccharimonadales bacterium]